MRTPAPKTLTHAEAAIWRKMIAAEPPALLTTASARQLLAQYCVHMAALDVLNEKARTAIHADEFEKLAVVSNIRAREEAAAIKILTSLRLTNQARVDKKTAGTAARKSVPDAAERKPWEAE